MEHRTLTNEELLLSILGNFEPLEKVVRRRVLNCPSGWNGEWDEIKWEVGYIIDVRYDSRWFACSWFPADFCGTGVEMKSGKMAVVRSCEVIDEKWCERLGYRFEVEFFAALPPISPVIPSMPEKESLDYFEDWEES